VHTSPGGRKKLQKSVTLTCSICDNSQWFNAEVGCAQGGAFPIDYRRRSGGQSKVTGSLRGSIKAAARIISTFLRVAMEMKRQ
jgi:hypothetical protein